MVKVDHKISRVVEVNLKIKEVGANLKINKIIGINNKVVGVINNNSSNNNNNSNNKVVGVNNKLEEAKQVVMYKVLQKSQGHIFNFS